MDDFYVTSMAVVIGALFVASVAMFKIASWFDNRHRDDLGTQEERGLNQERYERVYSAAIVLMFFGIVAAIVAIAYYVFLK